jgi:predicted house-cleaning noncanonical NTP pyrophosphatase (MazG superfamily)
MNVHDNLSEVFDVPTITKTTEVIDNSTGEIVESPTQKIESDYDKTRGNLQELLLKGQEALNAALEVAKQSEHPRAFEVVGNLMKQLADINQQLMDIHQQKQKLDGPKAEKVTNNNAIFVGSTAELNKLIKNMSKGE